MVLLDVEGGADAAVGDVRPPGVRDLDTGATREWLCPTGGEATRWAPSAACGPAVTTGCWSWREIRSRAGTWGVASLDPVLWWPSGARIRLGTHQWRSGVVDPAGHTYLERFDLIDGLPRWRWRVGAVVLERELAMAPGRPCLAARHRLLAGGPVTVALEVLCTWRDAHAEGTAPGRLHGDLGDGRLRGGRVRTEWAGPGFVPAGTGGTAPTCERRLRAGSPRPRTVACGPARGGLGAPRRRDRGDGVGRRPGDGPAGGRSDHRDGSRPPSERRRRRAPIQRSPRSHWRRTPSWSATARPRWSRVTHGSAPGHATP